MTTKELLEKAKAAKSVEELMQFAKENGMDVSPAAAKEWFEKHSKQGEIADDELDTAVGGCGGGGSSGPVRECPFCHKSMKVPVAKGFIGEYRFEFWDFYMCDDHKGWLFYQQGDKYIMVSDKVPKFVSLYNTNRFNPPSDQLYGK